MTAAAPGQAARDSLELRVRQAIASAGRCTAQPGKCTSCDGEVGDVMEIADHYAEAAQQPQPAPGDVLDITGEVLTAAVQDRRILPQLGSQEPQAAHARADEFARVKVKLCALVDNLDKTVEHGVHTEEFDQGAAHASAVTARQLRKILDDTALGTTPQPVPELAAAVAETRRVRNIGRYPTDPPQED